MVSGSRETNGGRRPGRCWPKAESRVQWQQNQRARLHEAQVRHHQDRADRAEKWLYQISVEIEQNFFGRDDSRPSQPPPPQAVSGQKR